MMDRTFFFPPLASYVVSDEEAEALAWHIDGIGLTEAMCYDTPLRTLQMMRRHMDSSMPGLRDGILRLLKSRREHGRMPPALLVRGLPYDPPHRLPQTPPESLRPASKDTLVSEACLLGLTYMLGGWPVGLEHEAAGEFLHQIVGSRDEAGHPHTDVAHIRTPPEYVVLSAVRGHMDAFMGVWNMMDILSLRFSEADREYMRERHFLIQSGGKTYRVPVLDQDRYSNPTLRLDLGKMHGDGPAASQMLSRLREVVQEDGACRKISLMPGEALVLDNRQAVYNLFPFAGSAGEEPLWLQRVYVTANIGAYPRPAGHPYRWELTEEPEWLEPNIL